jgi:WD40 repeat protein
LDGSKSGSIEGLDISSDGVYLVTGGADKLIKVKKYSNIYFSFLPDF